MKTTQAGQTTAQRDASQVATGDLVSLREIMAGAEDVKRVVRLEPTGTGRFRYLIETPFATFPKFVIGTTDAIFDDVRVEMRCGLLETAEAAWPRPSSNG